MENNRRPDREPRTVHPQPASVSSGPYGPDPSASRRSRPSGPSTSGSSRPPRPPRPSRPFASGPSASGPSAPVPSDPSGSGPSGRFYAHLVWKKAHEATLRSIMLTPNLPIQVHDGQTWTPVQPRMYKKIIDLILAYYNDFQHYLPIKGSEVLGKYVADIFTAIHAPVLDISVAQMHSLQRLESCVFISATKEIEITAQSWQACRDMRGSLGWRRNHGLYCFDFDSFIYV
ncbi:hypothetical protein QQS21_006751 [Conoideocrella luteorostrata]|uniref:Uncharacterized protein n=1 Tax=Conoideocrella luteorostrata TaxID=1105319 RepID=A0AAJ0CM06_9HYPO|nr:hypothetical protein QQS21_006751 [Conoideocrella luteorostrata]